MSTPDRPWTELELDQLRYMRAGGYTIGQAGQLLGRTAEACKSAGERAGIRGDRKPQSPILAAELDADDHDRRDAEHVRRCMEHGGFVRADKVRGRVEWVRP